MKLPKKYIGQLYEVTTDWFHLWEIDSPGGGSGSTAIATLSRFDTFMVIDASQSMICIFSRYGLHETYIDHVTNQMSARRLSFLPG